MSRPHGANENHFLTAAALAIIVFLAWLVAGNPELPLAELTGKLLHRLAIYLLTVTLTLAVLGGWKYQLIEQLKQNLIAIAIVAAAIILGAAEVLGR